MFTFKLKDMSPIAVHYQPIYQFISQRISSIEDAQDLTQEVFYKLIRSSQKGKSIDNPRHWLYAIAKNAVTDYYRKKKVIVEDISTVQFAENTIELLELTEEQRIQLKKYLLSLIDELPEDYQQIIRMSELQGIPQKEIAKELGINYATVRSKVQRGRARLRKTISDCCEIVQGGKGSIIGCIKRPTNVVCKLKEC